MYIVTFLAQCGRVEIQGKFDYILFCSFMGLVTSKQKLVTRSVKKFFLTSSLVSRYKGEDRRIERRRPSMERKKA